jgi:hypothetical protein
MKWHFEKTSSWQNVKLMKWHLTKCQGEAGKMFELPSCQVDEMPFFQIVKLTKC